jgi:arylsulfatase A-like enzyme
VFEQSVVPEFLAWAGGDPARPFVAYLNFQATHFPYAWPPDFAAPFGEAPLPDDATFVGYPRDAVPVMLDRFHNALAYQDLWLGRLIDGLRALGVWERTALVVVADHGEAFHEHGLVTHGTALHDEQVRVPMLLRLPGHAPRAITAPVSVLDALPSVARAIGLPRHGADAGARRPARARLRECRRVAADPVQPAGHDERRRPGARALQVVRRPRAADRRALRSRATIRPRRATSRRRRRRRRSG